MARPWEFDQWKFFTRFLVSLVVLGALAKGIRLFRLVAGVEDFTHWAPAVLLVSGAFAFMVWTARKWAMAFPGLALYFVLRLVLGLPLIALRFFSRVTPPLPPLLEVGALSLVTLGLGSCYMFRRPDSFEAVALSAAVVGIVLSLMSEYTLIPIVAGLGLVGIARLVQLREAFPPCRSHLCRKQEKLSIKLSQ